jgi:hypothetical protein
LLPRTWGWLVIFCAKKNQTCNVREPFTVDTYLKLSRTIYRVIPRVILESDFFEA